MKKGFTLIELLVVVAIIGLLASIVVVSLGTARKGGRDARAASDLRQIATAFELYYQADSPETYLNVADTWTDIPAAQSIARGGTTFMDPVPLGTGVKSYQWCDKQSPGDTYRLRVDLEEDKVGSLSGDYYYVTNTGTTAGAVTPAGGCTLP